MSTVPDQLVRKPTVVRPAPDDAEVRKPGTLEDRVRSLQLGEQIANRRILPTRFFVAVILLLAGGCGWLGYLAFASPRTASDAPTAAKPASPTPSTGTSMPVPSSSTAPAVLAEGNIATFARGYIIPRQKILVSPKVSGMIVRLNIEEGRLVEKGEVLAEIEDVEYRAEFERATAALNNARELLLELERGSRPEEIKQVQAELAEAEAQLVQMESEYRRNLDLRRKNIRTQAEFEESEAKYNAQLRRIEKLKFALKLVELGPRQERIDAAKAQVRQAEAELKKAKWKLDNCIIRSTIRGTILTKNAEEGNIVNPIAFQGSYSLCEMADLSDMEVELNIQERDIAKVFQGQKCEIEAEAFLGRKYQGYVSRLMPIADRAKGAVPVRVKIVIPPEEQGAYLKPEMGANVNFFKGPPVSKPVPESRNNP